MHVGIKIPNWGSLASPEALERTAIAADVRGFGSVWVSDHVAMPSTALRDYPYDAAAKPPFDPDTAFIDAFAALTFVAATTRHVQLGTGVLVLPLRHPIMTAKQAASVDVLSRGRLVLGVGIGWMADEFAVLGQDWTGRGRRTDEAIAVMRACWSRSPTELPGEFARFGSIAVKPTPTHGRHLPVLVGGHSAAAIRRAVRLGDGWYASNVTVTQFSTLARRVRERTAIERPGERLLVGVRPGQVDPIDAATLVDSFRKEGADFVVLDAAYTSMDVVAAENWVNRIADALALDGAPEPLVSSRASPAGR